MCLIIKLNKFWKLYILFLFFELWYSHFTCFSTLKDKNKIVKNQKKIYLKTFKESKNTLSEKLLNTIEKIVEGGKIEIPNTYIEHILIFNSIVKYTWRVSGVCYGNWFWSDFKVKPVWLISLKFWSTVILSEHARDDKIIAVIWSW